MIVFDASFLIALLDRTDALHDDAVQSTAALGEEPLATSAITAAEILVAPGRDERLKVIRDVLGIDVFAVESESSLRLGELRDRTGLKMPDCCVLALAESVGGRVASLDRRLAKAAGKLGLAVL